MRLENVRISFPNLFRASAFSPDQQAKFSAMFIVPKDHPQYKELQDELKKVKEEKWGKDKVSGLKLCVHDGSEKEEYDGLDDTVVYFNANNTVRPTVIDKDKSPLVEEDGRPYAGCYVNAIVDFWPQDNQYGKRVNASLRGVQFYAEGEAFGGGRAADVDDFDAIEGGEEDDDFLSTAA